MELAGELMGLEVLDQLFSFFLMCLFELCLMNNILKLAVLSHGIGMEAVTADMGKRCIIHSLGTVTDHRYNSQKLRLQLRTGINIDIIVLYYFFAYFQMQNWCCFESWEVMLLRYLGEVLDLLCHSNFSGYLR